ncbi:putative myb DNA-binding domain-containing protein [Cladorrhinum sp. PSN332]|nr:putative myb DNA-binding domain-containing protein [Cladorrhinum sp. PSN332]
MSHPNPTDQYPPSADSPTPSIPGTPTSTTTSLSALSTTAIKDGHRGSNIASTFSNNNPHTSSSSSHPYSHQNSHQNPRQIEAEQRADRISRLPGLSSISVSSSRFPVANTSSRPGTGTSNPVTGGGGGALPVAAYFDAAGQPVVVSKMSTVGSASATAESVSSTSGGGARSETTMGSYDAGSGSGSVGTETQEMDLDEDQEFRHDDEDEEDRDEDMDEEGGENESLVGFGEGAAGSTVEGPVYSLRGRLNREESSGTGTPVSLSALRERREARMVDGVSLDGDGNGNASNGFVDTTNTRGLFLQQQHQQHQATTSGIRETQVPGSHQHVLQHQRQGVAAGREAAERILSERLGSTGAEGIGSGSQGQGASGQAQGQEQERLGRFFFEER